MKKLALFSLLLVVLLITGFFVINPIAKYYLNKELAKIEKQENILFYGLEIDIFQNCFSLDSLSFNNKDSLHTFSAKGLSIKGIDYLALLKDAHISLDSFSIKSVKYQLKIDSVEELESNESKVNSPSKFNHITINHFKVESLDAHFETKSKEENAINQLSNLYIETSGLELMPNDSSKIKSFEKIKIYADSFSHNREHLQFSFKNMQLQNDSIQLVDFLIKTKKDYEFRHRKTSLDAKIEDIKIELALQELLRENTFNVFKVELDQYQVQAHMDKRKPSDEEIKSGLHNSLMNLPITLNLDRFIAKNGHISYSEQVKNSPKRGKVFFTDVLISATNLTNKESKLVSNPLAQLDLRGNLMGEGDLKAHIQFDLKSELGAHKLKGSLGKMDLTSLNEVLKPIVFVDFKSGQCEQLIFNFSANQNEAKGDLDFYYQNMKIQFHSRQNIKRPAIITKLGTGLVNALIVRRNNPMNNKFKHGSIDFQRDKTKSIFNFWWKSVFTGMANTIVN